MEANTEHFNRVVILDQIILNAQCRRIQDQLVHILNPVHLVANSLVKQDHSTHQAVNHVRVHQVNVYNFSRTLQIILGRPISGGAIPIGNPVKITRIGANSKDNSIQRVGGPVTIRKGAPNVHRPKPQHQPPGPPHGQPQGPSHGPPLGNPQNMMQRPPSQSQSGPMPQKQVKQSSNFKACEQNIQMKGQGPGMSNHPNSFKPRPSQPRETSPMMSNQPNQQQNQPHRDLGPRDSKSFRPTSGSGGSDGPGPMSSMGPGGPKGPRGPLTPDKKIGRNPVGIPKGMNEGPNQGFRPSLQKPRPSYPRPMNPNGPNQIAPPRQGPPGQNPPPRGPVGQSGPMRGPPGSGPPRGQAERQSPQSSPVLQRQHRGPTNQRPGAPPGVRPPNLSGRPPLRQPMSGPRPYGPPGGPTSVRGPPPSGPRGGAPSGPRVPMGGPRGGPMRGGPRPMNPRGPRPGPAMGQGPPDMPGGQARPKLTSDGMRPIQGIQVGRPVSIKTLKKQPNQPSKTNPSPTPGQQPTGAAPPTTTASMTTATTTTTNAPTSTNIVPDQPTQKPASDPQPPTTQNQSEQTAKVQSQSEKRNRFCIDDRTYI